MIRAGAGGVAGARSFVSEPIKVPRTRPSAQMAGRRAEIRRLRIVAVLLRQRPPLAQGGCRALRIGGGRQAWPSAVALLEWVPNAVSAGRNGEGSAG